MLRKVAAIVLVSVLMSLVLAPAGLADPPPPGTGVSCPDLHCGVGAVDPGAAGTPGAGAGPGVAAGAGTGQSGNNGASNSGGGSVISAPACSEQPMSPQPAAGSIWWRGNSPADGLIVQWVCTGGLTAATCTYCTDLTPHFAANGTAAGRCGAASAADSGAVGATGVSAVVDAGSVDEFRAGSLSGSR